MALDKLSYYRKQHKYTYQEVADRVGITKEYYWMIENGKRRLNYDLAVKIAKVFSMKPDDIFLNDRLTTSELKQEVM